MVEAHPLLVNNKSRPKKQNSKIRKKLFKLTNFPKRSPNEPNYNQNYNSKSFQEPPPIKAVSYRATTSFSISNKQPIDHSSNRKAYSSRGNQRELREVCSQIDNWSFEKIFKQTQYYQEHRKFNLAMAKSKVGVNPEYFDKILRDSKNRSKSFYSETDHKKKKQNRTTLLSKAKSVDIGDHRSNDETLKESQESAVFKNKLYFQEERRNNNMKLVNSIAEKNLR